jgi:hypothetical protein
MVEEVAAQSILVVTGAPVADKFGQGIERAGALVASMCTGSSGWPSRIVCHPGLGADGNAGQLAGSSGRKLGGGASGGGAGGGDAAGPPG